MASEHRIVKVNDLNPKRTRLKKYRRVYRGDVLRISKATDNPTNEIAQRFGVNSDYRVTHNSTTLLVMELRQGTNKLLPPNQGYGIPVSIPASTTYSEEVQAVLARMPNPLKAFEVLCIADFVNAEMNAGNWMKNDSFYHFGLFDELNARTSWIGPLKTATLGGAASLQSGVGLNLDGVDSFLATDFIPALDAVNYTLNDARLGVFVVDLNDQIVDNTLTGTESGTSSSLVQRQADGISAIAAVNAANTAEARVWSNDSLYLSARDSSTNVKGYKNGIEDINALSTSISISSGSIYVGARNTDIGTDLFLDGTISSFQLGAQVDFNHTVHYTNLTGLNDCLLNSAILDSFPAPLEEFEKTAITKFVLNEGAAANLNKYDEFYCFALTDPANALHGWIQSATATSVNSVHKPGIGYEFNGTTAYINSGFTPATSGVKHTLNDAQLGAFLIDVNSTVANATIYGSRDTPNDNNFRQDPGSNRLVFSINGNFSLFSTVKPSFAPNSLNITRRDNSANMNIVMDGVLIDTQPETSTGLPAIPTYIGARNNEGVADRFLEGVAATFQVGATIGMDQAAHYDNLITLLDDLNVFDNAVIDRYTGLTTTEETAIRSFVKAEVANRNWFKTDEFYCFSLAGANALIGMKGKTATNNGAVMSIEGATFNGAEWIDTNFIPSIDNVNYQLDNALYGYGVKTLDTLDGFSGVRSTFTNRTQAQFVEGSPSYAALHSAIGGGHVKGSNLNGSIVYAVSRVSANDTNVYIDGVPQGVISTVSDSIPSNSFYIGALNNVGAAGNYQNATISSFIVAAAVGFDQASHYTNHFQLLLDLDIFAKPIIDSFPNPLIAEEEVMVRDFVNSQVVSGNWGKMDSFVHFGMFDPVNALWDWKRRGAMINTLAEHEVGIGYKFNGVDTFIDTNWNPFTDRVASAQDNNNTGIFVKDVDINVNGSLYGGFPSAGTTSWGFFTGGALRYHNYNAIQLSGNSALVTNSLQVNQRIGGDQSSVVNGVNIITLAKTLGPDTSGNIYVGAYEKNGVAASFLLGTISSFMMGAAIDFNQLDYYNNLVELNNELKIESIIASFPNALSQGEEDAIRAYIVAELINGNFHKLDSLVFLNLMDSVNALWDVVRRVGMTNILAVHEAGVGYIFNGASSIDTGYNPSLGTNYKQDDALVSVFIVENTHIDNAEILNIVGDTISIVDTPTEIVSSVNAVTGASVAGNVINNTQYTIERTGATTSAIYKDGVSVGTSVVASGATPNSNIIVGGIGTQFTGTISMIQIGKAL